MHLFEFSYVINTGYTSTFSKYNPQIWFSKLFSTSPTPPNISGAVIFSPVISSINLLPLLWFRCQRI
jgi:hypothetical protein